MTPVEELFQLLWDTPKDKLTWFAIKKRMLEKEKEEMCNFVEYCNNRQREFIDGDLSSREYEGSIEDMFEWRYADKATKAKMTRERNKFWKEADEMRMEREKKFEQEANAKLETFNAKEK
jgi:hypothetical protein